MFVSSLFLQTFANHSRRSSVLRVGYTLGSLSKHREVFRLQKSPTTSFFERGSSEFTTAFSNTTKITRIQIFIPLFSTFKRLSETIFLFLQKFRQTFEKQTSKFYQSQERYLGLKPAKSSETQLAEVNVSSPQNHHNHHRRRHHPPSSLLKHSS